jgi:hypothetical protein
MQFVAVDVRVCENKDDQFEIENDPVEHDLVVILVNLWKKAD